MHFDLGWTTEDRSHLYPKGWQPQVTPKVVVRLVHGLGEHSGRYVPRQAVPATMTSRQENDHYASNGSRRAQDTSQADALFEQEVGGD